MCREIVLGAADSILCDVDCDEGKMNEGLLQVKYCAEKIVFPKKEMLQILYHEDCHRRSHSTSH